MKRNTILNLIILFTFWASVIIIIWIEFLPNLRIPSLWSGAGPKINSLSSMVCASFVTSYIFFYIHVRLKEKNDRKRKREEFNTHISLYLHNYQGQLNELLNEKDELITKQRYGTPMKLEIERLIHIFEPASQFLFYARHADENTKKFLQHRTKKYRNYFFALNKLIECVQRHHQLLDYYEDNEIYELFNVFIIINERENIEEELDQRMELAPDGKKHLYELDIDNIIMFNERFKNEPEYITGLEISAREYLDLYYRFAHHLECNIGILSNYLSKIDKQPA